MADKTKAQILAESAELRKRIVGLENKLEEAAKLKRRADRKVTVLTNTLKKVKHELDEVFA